MTNTIRIKSAVDRWNDNVPDRCFDLFTGRDMAYPKLLDHIRFLLSAFSPKATSSAIDVGCGIGFSTQLLRDLRLTAIGIDPSRASIRVAQKHFTGDYFPESLEAYAQRNPAAQYDIVQMLMTLHCIQDLSLHLRLAARLIAPAGLLIVTIPHPHRYLQHKPYFASLHFDYHQEACFELPFKVSGSRQHRSPVLYYHRPVEAYINTLTALGLQIQAFVEPADDESAALSDVLTLVAYRPSA